ncbi:hypothetical protein DICA3_F25752 [Diutina catenulata]
MSHRLSGETLREPSEPPSAPESPASQPRPQRGPSSTPVYLNHAHRLLDRTTPDADAASVFTAGSEDTLVDQVKVCGVAASQFSTVRMCPIVSQRLHQGAFVFESADAAKADENYLMLTKWGSLFKPIYMSLVLPSRQVYCRVYHKTVSVHLGYYRLEFADDDLYLLCNNSYTPTVDFTLRGTQMRVMGLAGASIGGRSLLQMFVLKPGARALACVVSNKKAVLQENELYEAIERQDRLAVATMIDSDRPLIHVPVAAMVEEQGKLGKFLKHGHLKLFSCGDRELELRMMAVLMVLREQENRKFRGSNPVRPS